MDDPSATSPAYVLDPEPLWRRETLDEMQVLYHRPSGQTHILIEPAPQIIDCLLAGPLTAEQLLAELAQHFAFETDDDGPETEDESDLDRLAARLEEMVTLGFVSHINATDRTAVRDADNAA
ncbi:MAG: HPr-rel-A system PqqD family peptide chaperone [Pseudomonadota bacterium]